MFGVSLGMVVFVLIVVVALLFGNFLDNRVSKK
jgi:hypothetical protein